MHSPAHLFCCGKYFWKNWLDLHHREELVHTVAVGGPGHETAEPDSLVRIPSLTATEQGPASPLHDCSSS